MIISGTVLPLMDLVFGKFVNVFNDFVIGELSPAGYRSKVGEFRYAIPDSGLSAEGTTMSDLEQSLLCLPLPRKVCP
jgi:ATP-binding cassette subfamily B (MDR/TAP) protein 1